MNINDGRKVERYGRWSKSEVRGLPRGETEKKSRFVLAAVAVIAIGLVLCFALFSKTDTAFGNIADKIVGSVLGHGFGGVGGNNGNAVDRFETEGDGDTESGFVSESESDSAQSELVNTDKTEADTCADTSFYFETDISDIGLGNDYIANLTDEKIDVKALLGKDVSDFETSDTDAPLVLIVHTDATEEYLDSHCPELDGNIRMPRNVASVGDGIAAELNRLGISAIHCGAIHGSHDSDADDDTADTVLTMLKIYPSVKCVIDIGRQSLTDADGRPARTVSGTKDAAAQIRMYVSLWGSGDGREDNMVLALRLRELLNEENRRLCAPICLTQKQYCSALSRYYLKVEIGATGNITAESVAAGRHFAHALAEIIG